jgi:hypothetical protein
MKKVSKKRLDEWVKWSLFHLESKRVDPFLQGWRCARAILMAVDGIPEDVREEMVRIFNNAESKLWQKTRGKK